MAINACSPLIFMVPLLISEIPDNNKDNVDFSANLCVINKLLGNIGKKIHYYDNNLEENANKDFNNFFTDTFNKNKEIDLEL